MFSVSFLHYAEKCVSKEPDQSVTFFRKKVEISKHICLFIFFKCWFPDVKIHEESDSGEKKYAFGTSRLVKPEKPVFWDNPFPEKWLWKAWNTLYWDRKSLKLFAKSFSSFLYMGTSHLKMFLVSYSAPSTQHPFLEKNDHNFFSVRDTEFPKM